MRGIIIMAVIAVCLLGGSGVAVYLLGGKVEYEGNPAKTLGVEEEAGKVMSGVKESASTVMEKASGVTQPESGEPSFDVHLPVGLSRASFGDPLEEISQEYEPAWRKKQRSKTTFAHYPENSESQLYVFEFGSSGLSAMEIRVKPTGDKTLDGVYRSIMQNCKSRFGDENDQNRRRWHDDDMRASLKKGPNYVAIRFQPR